MSNMETMQETVGKALDNIAERREQFQAAQEGAEKPEFKEIGGGHYAACHHLNKLN